MGTQRCCFMSCQMRSYAHRERSFVWGPAVLTKSLWKAWIQRINLMGLINDMGVKQCHVYHPAVITINRWYGYHSQSWVVKMTLFYPLYSNWTIYIRNIQILHGICIQPVQQPPRSCCILLLDPKFVVPNSYTEQTDDSFTLWFDAIPSIVGCS